MREKKTQIEHPKFSKPKEYKPRNFKYKPRKSNTRTQENQTQNTRAQTQIGVQSGHKKRILMAKPEATTVPFSPNPELAINGQ